MASDAPAFRSSGHKAQHNIDKVIVPFNLFLVGRW